MSSGDREAQQRELRELDEQIRYHEQLYRAGQPEISDAVFDDLVDRFKSKIVGNQKPAYCTLGQGTRSWLEPRRIADWLSPVLQCNFRGQAVEPLDRRVEEFGGWLVAS